MDTIKKRERIIKKCENLLEMAKGKANIYESVVAMRHLHALLIKHQIELDDIEGSIHKISPIEFKLSDAGKWSRNVVNAISNLYFCKMAYGKVRGTTEVYIIYGDSLNSSVACEMSFAACKTIKRLANKESKTQKGGKIDYKFVTSFKNSASKEIVSRCKTTFNYSQAGKLIDPETKEKIINQRRRYSKEFQRINKYLDSLEYSPDLKKPIKVRKKTSSIDLSHIRGAIKGRQAGEKIPIQMSINNDK